MLFRSMDLFQEGIRQATEASEIFARDGEAGKQAQCLINLASLLREDEQLDAAEETASRAINLLGNHSQYRLCQGHDVLGQIHQSKGNTEKAIHHFETSLRIASPLNIRDQLFEAHLSLANLYFQEDRPNEAQTHIEHVKLHTGNNMFDLGRALMISTCVLEGQNRVEEAKSEATRALAVFEELGLAYWVEEIREVIKDIEESNGGGKPLKWCSSSHLLTPLIRTQI